MKILKVLSIGNSFSDDAQRYLYQIARAGGQEMKVVNAYIGGCSLHRHYTNMLSGERAYQVELNGFYSGLPVGLQEILLNDEWDVVTLQQASHFSHCYDTYQPYLNELAAFVRKCCPNARLLIHQTWAYEQGSHRLCTELGYKDQAEMFRDLKDAYAKAAEAIKSDGILPSGETFQNALAYGISKVHRDTFHADLGIGRYMLASTWYQALTGKAIFDNPFRDFDVPVEDKWISIAQKASYDAVTAYGWTVK